MSVDISTRLPSDVFNIDSRMARGRYTDQYFLNVQNILEELSSENYGFDGESPIMPPVGPDPCGAKVGDIQAEMQFFTRRRPASVACGVDHALAILSECCGWCDADEEFHNTAGTLSVEAVFDGEMIAPTVPCLKVRGRYRDFGPMETTILGVLSRQTSVATNTYELLEAADGKPVFFFPARYDLPATQSADGYAYAVGVEAYNRQTGHNLKPLITSEAQGEWWGGSGGGTVSHSYILSFFGDCAEAMMHFCRILPPETNRIALVDTTNDCVQTTVNTALKLFDAFRKHKENGQSTRAEKYKLYGVRCDTAGQIRDASVSPLGNPDADCGVVPRLVTQVRNALDALHNHGDIPDNCRDMARRYFQNVKIFVSGGFDVEKIARFERVGAPVDGYGVGSAFFTENRNDFTADVVRVKIDDQWVHMAKAGRATRSNPCLRPVELE